VRLPVSAIETRFRLPDGNDDIAILDASGSPVEQALAILPRLARMDQRTDARAGDSPDARSHWKDLTVTDFESALLDLRRFLFGDSAGCVFRAPSHKCGVPMELQFSISSLLAEVKPMTPHRVEEVPGQKGWYEFAQETAEPLRFRLPTVADQTAVLGHPDAETELAGRCIRSEKKLAVRARRQVERAMESMAPSISRTLAGECAECGEVLTMMLHVPRLVVDELRLSASGVLEDIHAIASTYRWDEASIAALPQSRRKAYAATIRRLAGATL
jgi:hypothetical protein